MTLERRMDDMTAKSTVTVLVTVWAKFGRSKLT